MATEVITAQKQPDISYHPDLAKYQARTERLKQQRLPEVGLPAGFPEELHSPLVWEGKDFADEKEWTLVLDEAQLQEVRDALAHFKCELIYGVIFFTQSLSVM